MNERETHWVMPNMMDGGMWGMGIGGLIVLIVLVLVIAALVKYLFFFRRDCQSPNRTSPIELGEGGARSER